MRTSILGDGFPRPVYEKPEGGGAKSAEEMADDVVKKFEETNAKHQKALDTVKEVAEKALAEAQKGNGTSKELATKADEALLQVGGLKEELDRLQQKLAARKGDGGEAHKSIGERFTDSDSFKNLVTGGRRGRAVLDVKAILTSVVTDTAGAVGDAINQTRLPNLYMMPDRQFRVRDLLTPGRMEGSTLEYVKETGFTNSAAPVAEGAAKPQSDIKLDLVSTTAKVIAHYMKASRQVMDDVPMLRSIIDQRLLYGLRLVEENQLLNGDGTGQNLLGLIPQATAYAAPITVASPTSIDIIRLAILQVYLAEFPATGIVLNPGDWARIELTKDSTGQYIIGNPQGTIPARLWGLPVVETQAMTVDKFLVGAFKMGAQIFDRWAATVQMATENEDDFLKNLVALLAEERLALACYRPQAFVYGDFGISA
jgi:HK97 family phage major capsid protein